MESLPVLAYVYDPLSFSPLSITEAAEGVCQVLWIIDGSKPDASVMARLLRKFGLVIDSSHRDLDEVAAEIRSHRPDGILSMHDGDLLWTAQLAQRLDLPFHSIESARQLTDKNAQRVALAAAGLAVPQHRILERSMTLDDVTAIGSSFRYPAVLKPRWGQSSRDTLPISSLEELVRTIGNLDSYSDEDFVLEGFVPDASSELGGRGFDNFVSVETVVENGSVHHAGISGRTPFRWPFRETGYFTPSALEPAVEVDVLLVATQAAHALGVTIGCLHTEIKLTDDGPVVIEVNGRPGGGMSEMLERASGFSILRTALCLAVGAPIDIHGLVDCSRVGYLLYVFPPTDVDCIDVVDGLADLGRIPGVDEVVLVRGPGQRIDWREGSEAHVCHLTGTTANQEELLELIESIPRIVRIEGHDDPR